MSLEVESTSTETTPAETTTAPETASAPETPSTPTPEPGSEPSPTKEAPALDTKPLKEKIAAKAKGDKVLAEGEAPVIEAPKPYVPNMKFKVMDKEHEIDAFLKDVIKDKETEDKVRDLYQKALGLEFTKARHETLQAQYNNFESGFKNLNAMAQDKGKFKEFLDFWKIPKENLYEHVASLLRYEDLPPEQKAAEDRKLELETRTRQVELHNQQLQQERQNFLIDNRQRELDTAISRADIAEIAQEYDARVGKPGAFKQEVIRRGKLAAYETRTDIPVDQALHEVMTSLGYVSTGDAQPQAGAPLPIVASVAQKKLPVLPNVGGGGASPVNRPIKSLSEMRALGKQMRG